MADPARPLILLSNDDGFEASGLVALRKELARFADVVTCAPQRNQSAASHALTLKEPLRLRQVEERCFALDGTPADCIYVALHSEQRVLPRWPDLVVSGMNDGPNLGLDVMYSGTVAAAREAAQRGIPAIAISASGRAKRGPAAALGATVVREFWRSQREVSQDSPKATTDEAGSDHAPPGLLLNLNIPAGAAWELHATRLGRRLYDNTVVYRTDPRGAEYLWIGGGQVRHDTTAGTDTAVWERGQASLTALTLSLDAGPEPTLVAEDVVQRLDP